MDKPGDETGDQGRALRAGNADDGDAAVFTFGKQTAHDRLADRPRLAVGWHQMHVQAGSGIHFDDGAALFFERARDVLGDDVDAGDVQAYHAGGERDDRIDIGVNEIGHVVGDVAVALDQHFLALAGNRLGRVALPLQFEHDGRVFLDQDEAEREVVPWAAPRIAVELPVYQLGDADTAVAEYPGSFALGRRHDAAADHQQAVLVAGYEALDHDAAAFVLGDAEGILDFLLRPEISRHAATVVAVARLDHHRQADVLSGLPGFTGTMRNAPFRHRHAAGGEQALGEVLVA